MLGLGGTVLGGGDAPPPVPQEYVVPQEVRSLPGSLDPVWVFNSNSPEVVQTNGILLSTFPRAGKAFPGAHLPHAFQGRFDIFAHHIAKAEPPDDSRPDLRPDSRPDLRTLYWAILVGNASDAPATVDLLQGASYLSQPDAPFVALPGWVENPTGGVYAGPGSRAADTVLRGQRQDGLPAQIVIPPGETRLLVNLPIPVRGLEPPINGRSSLLRLRSDRPVYLASLARFADRSPTGEDSPPTLADWQTLLQTADVAGPRDRPPTPLGAPGQIIYGRVAGVAQGSRWQGQITDANAPRLTIPERGRAIAYGLGTLHAGRLGTGQIQTTPMVARYDDTAYATHGNYGIEYTLSLPLHNASDRPQTVAISLQTPIKFDAPTDPPGLRFFDPLPTQTFFRGTVRIRDTDERGLPRTRYVHLVQRRGDRSQPLTTVTLPTGGDRLVELALIYPADSTPPQVVAIETLVEP